jgi:hypothetical protein
MATQAETNIGTQLELLGLPADTAQAVLQAVDTAGYSISEKGGGTPAEAVAVATSVQRVSLGGKVPGGFIVAVGVPGKGYLVWPELQAADNTLQRLQPVFVPDAGGGSSELWT